MNNGMTEKRYEHIAKHINSLDLDLEKGVIRNRKAASLRRGYPMARLGEIVVSQHQIFAVARWGRKCIGMTVNHKNEIKTDNSWNNLELLTNKENIKLRKKARHEVIPIKGINIKTGETLVFDSQQEASRKLGLLQGQISRAINGVIRKTGGWKFERIPLESEV